MLLVKAIPFLCFIHCISAAECARDCYGPCPSDYCFMMGALSSSVPVYFSPNNYYSASQYCKSLGCNLPTFMNAQELADVNTYRTCMGINGTFIFLDYVMKTYTPSGWIVQPTNMRAKSTLFNTNPPWAATEPNGNSGQPCMLLDTSGNIYDAECNWNAWPIPTVCMCPVCPGNMCGGLTNGVINPPVVGNFQFPYRPGSQVSFSCNTGYFFEQSSSTCVQGSTPYPQWSSNPVCLAGCVLPTLPNGTVSVTSAPGGLVNGVYQSTTTITYACNSGYYLSTLTSPPLIAKCIVSANNVGDWNRLPSCQPGCLQLTMATGTGSVSYLPNIPTYSPTGYVPQTILAVFNCTSGYYLDPPNYTYNCTGFNGIWDLGNSAPVCKRGCPIVTTFPNGLIVYKPTTNLITGVYRWTSVATFNCSTGYYLSTLTSTTITDCNAAGNWTGIPQCLPGCQRITTFTHGQTIPYIPSQQVNSLYPQNTMAIFNCSAGYYLSTLTTVNSSICTASGHWSFVPNCIIGCPDIGSFPNGNYTYTDVSGTTAYLDNSLCRQATRTTFTCNFQYFLSTMTLSTTTDCNSSGRWTSVPTCILGCLANDTQLQIANGARSSFVTSLTSPINGYLYQTGDSVNFTCTGSNYLSSGSPAVCTAGHWLGIPSCLAIPAQTTLASGTDSGSDSSMSSLSNYSVTGYVPSKQIVSNCTSGACNVIPIVLTVTKISMTLSCSFLVIAIGIIIVVTIIIRDFSIETCLHLNEEFALFFAHLLLLIFRDRVDLTIECQAASAGIQYFFTTASLCMLIEAVHSNAILQNVISFGGVFDYPRLKNFLFGWIIPIIPTGVTIAMRYDQYPSTYGCYVNLGDKIALFIMGPIIVCFCLTIILTEAAAMGDWKPLPLSSKFQRLAAHVNQKAMAPLVFLSFGSWFFGLWASYLNSPYVYSFGSVINMAFGVSVVVFHFFGNPKLNNWLHQKVLKNFCNKQPDS